MTFDLEKVDLTLSASNGDLFGKGADFHLSAGF